MPVFLIMTLLLLATPAQALEITSVAPHRATPATPVVLSGGPFSVQSRIFLGEQLVPASRTLPNRLEFIVPELLPGSYSLTVQDDADTAIQPFLFEVLALPPLITGVVPDNVDYCSDQNERLITITGENFLPGTMALIDGKVVASRTIDATSLQFRLPEMPAGVYGVQVRNTDGAASLPHSLWINSLPEISTVERGGDYVNNYEMIIRGKNFFYNSILMVREPENSTFGRDYRQLAFRAGQDGSTGYGNFQAMPGEQLTYRDCTTLIYQRYPLDMQDKDLILQVINPDGKKTDPFPVTLP